MVYFQVVDPVQAVLGVDNFRFASQRIAMTSLRSIIGRHELDNLLAHREDVNNEMRTVIAASTQHWGVEVRTGRAARHHAAPRTAAGHGPAGRGRPRAPRQGHRRHGELEASQELSEAAAKLYESPGALQLRALQTLAEVASEHNSTLVFPVPIELLTGFITHGVPPPTPCRRWRSSHPRLRRHRSPRRPGTGWTRTGRLGWNRPMTCGAYGASVAVAGPEFLVGRARTFAAMASRDFSSAAARSPSERASMRTQPGGPRCGHRRPPPWRRGRRRASAPPWPGRASSPPRPPDEIGTPITGREVTAASTPGEVRGLARPRDQRPEAPARGLPGELERVVGRAMSREHADLDRDPNSRSASTAPSMIGASDALPITTPTVFIVLLSL